MSSGHPKKQKFLERLAEENGVAIVVVDEASQEISVSNNNSICRALSSSAEFAASCAQYCGKAFERTKDGSAIDFECYAGLTCKAVPVVDGGRSFTAIIGRIFLKAENYRMATEKAINGEWRNFRPTEFFENVLIGGSDGDLSKVEERLAKFTGREHNDILELDKPQAAAAADITELIDKYNREKLEKIAAENIIKKRTPVGGADEITAWRSLFGSLMEMEYRQACRSILIFLQERYALPSLVWLERREDRLESLSALGELDTKPLKIGITTDNLKLFDAAHAERPVKLIERMEKNSSTAGRILNLFPVVVGGDVRGAIGVEAAGENADVEVERKIARFARTVASPLEILRLRGEVSLRDSLSRAVMRFNEGLKNIDGDDFWLHITQISAELLHAERASILISDEKSRDLHAKAAIGSRINLLSEESVGSRVARRVLDAGSPVMVSNITETGMKTAPLEWRYKTNSFISYPIVIGERKVGIMNFTDKAGGDTFNRTDLELLKAIAPQIAVAIDRTALKDKAGEYEQLSVTDTLTGLLNRRYIEERLAEEITRSKRHRFPMSLLMLDVDNFKSYNDSFGHPAGDIALRMVADVLKETLRGADVAARYGGEEFAILLPQTSSEEAEQIAERIRQRIERTAFPMRKVTASIGIAVRSNEISTAKDLVSAADVALYDAKNHGRNSVRTFSDLGDSLIEKIH